jgi:hypothetical protein
MAGSEEEDGAQAVEDVHVGRVQEGSIGIVFGGTAGSADDVDEEEDEGLDEEWEARTCLEQMVCPQRRVMGNDNVAVGEQAGHWSKGRI